MSDDQSDLRTTVAPCGGSKETNLCDLNTNLWPENCATCYQHKIERFSGRRDFQCHPVESNVSEGSPRLPPDAKAHLVLGLYFENVLRPP